MPTQLHTRWRMFATMVTLLAIIAVILIAAWYWTNRHQDERGGFRDWVKNLAWQEWSAKNAAEEQRQLEQLTVPDDMPESEIRALVERLLEVDTDRFTMRRLQLLGERAVPALLTALKDPRFLRDKKTDSWVERLPLEKVMNLLNPFAPAEAVPALVPLLRHKDYNFRKTAAFALGNIGSDACIEPMTAALADEDDYVRSNAMTGIQSGLEAKRGTPRFLEAMFERIVPLLERSDSTVGGEAPVTLLQIDRAKAISVLLGERYFTAANRELHYILRALNAGKVPVPANRLERLIQELKPKSKDYPFDYSYGEALVTLARTGGPSAEKILREALQSENERVGEDAARALCITNGIPEPMDFVYGRLKEVGFDRLTQPQQTVYALSILDAEVCNGGFSQYFVNSSGNQASEALRGLELVGAKQTLKIVREAFQQFGPNGPPRDRQQRASQLAALTKTQDAALDRLNSEYYKSPDRLKIKLLLFAIENKEHFRAQPGSQVQP
jgi:hypothetical protein